MNTKVDPCDNFFEFACGQWVESHQIPEDKGAIDQMELTTNKVEYELQGIRSYHTSMPTVKRDTLEGNNLAPRL